MTDKDKQIHDLKFELRQQRQRIDGLEEELNHVNKTINNILATQLEEMRVITILADSIAKLIKEREDKE